MVKDSENRLIKQHAHMASFKSKANFPVAVMSTGRSIIQNWYNEKFGHNGRFNEAR